MIKRVNSTGRRRITRDLVSIDVLDGDPRSFNATIDLSQFDAPADAAVVLEATCAGSNTIRRFDFGTVANVIPPPQRTLTDLQGENVFFSLKVIDRSERFGRILGLAENIRPLTGGERTATGRRGILPVEQVDLGDELWKLQFRTEEVFLLVNSRIPELADQLRYEPGVFTLVYPAVIREVLGRAIEEQPDTDEEGDDHWPVLWLRFGRGLHPEQEPAPDAEDTEACRDWIDEVVTSFCREHKLRDKFSSAAGGEGQG